MSRPAATMAVPPTVGHEPFSAARMRGSLAWFTAGKAVSAVIGLAWILLLVRALPVDSYGGYVVLLALLEIVLSVSNLGVYPFALRYITEARQLENVVQLPGLVWKSVLYRASTLLVSAVLIALAAGPLGGLVGQPQLAALLGLYTLVIVFEGMARYIELVFESMLDQGFAQLCAVSRNGLRVLLVAALWSSNSEVTLKQVVVVEIVASSLGALLALLLLHASVRRARSAARQSGAARGFSMRRVASFTLPMYLAMSLSLLYHPDTLKLLVSRLLGVVEAAAFGFAHTISNVLLRYLPANLLLGLIRPMLVARRSRQNSDQQLMAVANIILKTNLLLISPVIAVFGIAGYEVMHIASGGRFDNAWPILFVLTLLLALLGLHVVLSMLATTIESRSAVLVGTLVSVPGVLIGVYSAPQLGLLAMGLGLWVSEIMYCIVTLVLIRRCGLAFRVDWAGWLRIALAAALAAAAAQAVLLTFTLSTWGRLGVSAVVVSVVYVCLCYFLSPFSRSELMMVQELLPSRFRRLPHAR